MTHSPDSSDSSDEWDHWEVVDVQTTTSKSGPSMKILKEQKKKKEVENLASLITARLAVNQAEEKIKMSELNVRIQAQQDQSETQLEIIRKQLETISRLQAMHSQQNAQNQLIAAKDKNEQAKLIEQACNQAALMAATQATQAVHGAANEAARKAATYATQQASAQVSEAATIAAEKAANHAATQAAQQAAQQANYQASQRDNAFLTNILNNLASNKNNNGNNNNGNNNNLNGNSNENQPNMSSMNSDLSGLNPMFNDPNNNNSNYNNNNTEMKSSFNTNNMNNNNNSMDNNDNNGSGGGGGLLSALSSMFVGSNNDEAKSSTLLDDDCFWDCVACGAANDEAYQFCPKCGARNDLVFNTNINDLNSLNATAQGFGGLPNIHIDDGTSNDNSNNSDSKTDEEQNNAINVNLLKYKGAIGQDKKFSPGEARQCGWIFQNESSHKIVMNVSIVAVNESDKLVQCDFEKSYEIKLGSQEDYYLLFNARSPIVPGNYSNLYQLITDDGKIIPHTLELMLNVKNAFTLSKEKKISDIVKMGFDDRQKIVYALQQKKWNVQNAVDSLLQG